MSLCLVCSMLQRLLHIGIGTGKVAIVALAQSTRSIAVNLLRELCYIVGNIANILCRVLMLRSKHNHQQCLLAVVGQLHTYSCLVVIGTSHIQRIECQCRCKTRVYGMCLDVGLRLLQQSYHLTVGIDKRTASHTTLVVIGKNVVSILVHKLLASLYRILVCLHLLVGKIDEPHL